jgi:hypothetical protein
MSISGIFAATLTPTMDPSGVEAVSAPKQIKQTWKSLDDSLSSGDIAAAQSAFAIVQQLQAQQAQTGEISLGQSQLDSAIQQLGSALSAGDLSAARFAYTSLQAELRAEVRPAQATVETVVPLASSNADVQVAAAANPSDPGAALAQNTHSDMTPLEELISELLRRWNMRVDVSA